jgi:hypothetical protein
VIVAYLIFFVAGLVFGGVIASNWAFSVLAVPVILALASAAANGVDGYLLLTLLLALIVTAGGVLLGRVVAARLEERRPAAGA